MSNIEKTGPGQVSHGIYSWLKTGKVNPSIRGFRKIQTYIREIEKDLVNDLGGEENLTAAQEVLVKSTIEAYGVLLLSMAYCRRHTIFRPDKLKEGVLELQPVLGHQTLAFLNTLRQNLVVLGLDKKKVDEALTVTEYIEKYGKEEDKKSPEKPVEGRPRSNKGKSKEK